eukprot:2332108-Alexandrium_andersonii.AAC.1
MPPRRPPPRRRPPTPSCRAARAAPHCRGPGLAARQRKEAARGWGSGASDSRTPSRASSPSQPGWPSKDCTRRAAGPRRPPRKHQ